MQGLKLLLIVLLSGATCRLSGQSLNGILLDKATGMPVANASINTASSITFSSSRGVFTLAKTRFGDTLRISCIGYRPLKLTLGIFTLDTLRVFIEQSSILLRQVTVTAIHDPRMDSVKLRKEFSGVFNYKGPSLKDAFPTNSSTAYVPYNYSTSPNNATTLASVNLLSVINYFTKKNTPTAKLQKTMLKDEELNYVDQKFSKQKISGLTSLKGDSLLAFIDKYRPSIADIKSMSEYDLIIYIKKSYDEFIKTYKDEKSPFIKNE